MDDPASPEFATIHIVGEAYASRGPLNTPIPNPTTLQGFADLYHQPIEEFVRLNQQRWGPSDVVGDGEEIKVPDPGFATQLTTRMSAQALIQPDLGPNQRTTWLRRLVPLASANATVLDTVLARLILAAKPVGEAWDTIERVGGGFPEPPSITTAVGLPS
jgi:hypothetical protein